MILDYLGASISLVSTLCFISQSPWAWPLSVLATLLNGFLYGKTGIYADMILECFYCISSFYGWYQWQKNKKEQAALSVSALKYTQALWVFISVAILYFTIAYPLRIYTHSNVVVLDALTTALSIVGQCLMCYKFIMTWFIWLIADVIYLSLYLSKNLPAHAALMMVYVVLAMIGYWKWAKCSSHIIFASYKTKV